VSDALPLRQPPRSTYTFKNGYNNNNNNNNNKGVKLDNKHWYDHVPKSVEPSNEGKVTRLWNQQARNDRTFPNNKPDIMIRDNKQGTCMLIDAAIPGDRNVAKKETEKILEHEDFIIHIQRMWNVKAKVIPVTIGATGTTS
jgi:hypothetical protein